MSVQKSLPKIQRQLLALRFPVVSRYYYSGGTSHRMRKVTFSPLLSSPSSHLRIRVRALKNTREMHIQSIPMWEGQGNNYAYLVTDEASKETVIIDPANPPEVLPVLKEKMGSGAIRLSNIINTHHHQDHAGGNAETLKHYPVPIIGGSDCDQVTRTPAHGETFTIGKNINVKALHTPCHTQDSICFLFQDGEDKAVFTGDTLFIGGCGRFFEGTPEQMHKALNETLASLPDDTKVYPGHEYTKGNLKFAVKIAQQDEAVQKLQALVDANKQTQGKSTIGDEKKHNVFMRVKDPYFQKVTGSSDPIQVMAKLREMKNSSNTFQAIAFKL